jgi:hypothetical protein
MENHDRLFNQLTDEQLISCARRHQVKFNKAWNVVMSSHYRTGRYIDASVDMDREYGALGTIGKYIYNNRSAATYNEYLSLNSGI